MAGVIDSARWLQGNVCAPAQGQAVGGADRVDADATAKALVDPMTPIWLTMQWLRLRAGNVRELEVMPTTHLQLPLPVS
jgi:hypothetical protein